MSGGSYNYLCRKGSDDLMSGSHGEDLERMRDRLLEEGAIDAAAQTDAVLATVKMATELVRMRADALRDVWQAVEWIDSCDWGPDSLDAALAKYRGEASDG